MLKPHSIQLRKRIERHRAFYAGSQPGDLLFYVEPGLRCPQLVRFLCAKLHEMGTEVFLKPSNVKAFIQEYVAHMRGSLDRFYAVDDDSVPCASVYWGIGGITAAMIGGDPVFDGSTSWLEPNLLWPEIDQLSFDPDNRWIGFALEMNRALWDYWEEDFAVLPFLHRSPLDAANGIRGTELFLDMFEAPERVTALADWCADWSIALERHLKREAPRPDKWGVGVWGAWLPDDAVFVNGDPVGLISAEQAEQFDRPSVEKLFTSTGGGFFHNHTVGLHQVECVSSYRGTLVQWFVDDPKQPSLASALVDHPKLRDKILAASLQCPIAGWVTQDRLEHVVDIVRHGRFILALRAPENVDVVSCVDRAKQQSNLR